jgi:hypothetical protein
VEHPRAAVALYETVREIETPSNLSADRDIFLERLSDATVKGYAMRKKRRAAIGVFFSKHYSVKKRLSAKGLYHLSLILHPAFDRIRRYS